VSEARFDLTALDSSNVLVPAVGLAVTGWLVRLAVDAQSLLEHMTIFHLYFSSDNHFIVLPIGHLL
jgi:hypothetical protein